MARIYVSTQFASVHFGTTPRIPGHTRYIEVIQIDKGFREANYHSAKYLRQENKQRGGVLQFRDDESGIKTRVNALQRLDLNYFLAIKLALILPPRHYTEGI